MEISFEAPFCEEDTISKIQYTSCDGSMQIVACTFRGEHWYLLLDRDRSRQRWVRLFNANALHGLVEAYAYVDSDGCMNQKKGIVHRGPKQQIRGSSVLNKLSDEQRIITGVPQRTHNSGLCWYCAMCFVMFFSPQMRHILYSSAPRELQRKMQDILIDKDKSEILRKHLYEKYALGDRPGQDPALDGQNGFAQLCILLARLDIPTIRLFAPDMHELNDGVRDQKKKIVQLRSSPGPDETSLLVVRAFRTKWAPKPRIVYKGRRYRLLAVMIGSEHCGHQIACSAIDIKRCSTWALSDSDATQRGIGPMFWSTPRRSGESNEDFTRRWRQMWSDMVPITLFGSGHNRVCDLNPINRPTHELERNARITNEHPDVPGVVNSDFIYMHTP